MRPRLLFPCVAALLVSGCGLVLGLDDFRDAPAGGACTTPKDCPGTGECVVATCNDGVCGASNVPEGTTIAEQKSGDCKQVVCDGAGATKNVNDDGDVPVDGTDCTADLCMDGVPSNPPATMEAKCSDSGGKVCDGAGRCVACVVTADCASPEICKKNQCLDPACDDGVKDGTESDLDCGGKCAPCDDDKGCGVDADCASSACRKNVCVSQCADGKQDGAETDVDCGGGTCPACVDGAACGANEDCASHTCVQGLCFAQECADGTKNGSETDVDCGGTCPACGNAKACIGNDDCVSGECVANVCGCVVDVAAGWNHTCARKGDGTLWCWGSNQHGELGDGTTNNSPSPVQVAALGTDVVRVGAGGVHTCALKGDGTLWCWGDNQYGQLGDGTTQGKKLPVQVTALGASVKAVGLGYDHTCAAKVDGSLWCWGRNSYGALGDGTTTDKSLPVQVPSLGFVGKAAGGLYYTCAGGTQNMAAGVVWCWGENDGGQIGDGTTLDKVSPVKISQGSMLGLVTGAAHTCVFGPLGDVYCWGLNYEGQLGDGTTTNKSSPVQIAAIGNNVIELAAGDNHTCSRKGDGTLWCWGRRVEGQVGDSCAGANCVKQTSPAQVAALGTSVVQIVARGNHTCARKDDGTLWCWGDGTGSPSQVPLTCP